MTPGTLCFKVFIIYLENPFRYYIRMYMKRHGGDYQSAGKGCICLQFWLYFHAYTDLLQMYTYIHSSLSARATIFLGDNFWQNSKSTIISLDVFPASWSQI